jgi:hypothetical protein
MLNEDNVEKLRHSLDPIERILRDIMSTDHYVTIEDMRDHAEQMAKVCGHGQCVFIEEELINRFCRTFG